MIKKKSRHRRTKRYIIVFRAAAHRRRKGDPLGIREMLRQAELQFVARR